VDKPDLETKKQAKELRRRGFDLTKIQGTWEQTFIRKYRVHIGCSQCAAMVINGVACHETGCPNARAAEGGQ
jgi:urease accessory protein UreF